MNTKQLAVFAILTKDVSLTGVAPMYMHEKYEAILREEEKPEYLLDSSNRTIFNLWKAKWGVS